MNFTIPVFIFLFFPISVVAYWICGIIESKWFQRIRLRDFMVVLISGVFYTSFGLIAIKYLVLYIAFVYSGVRLMQYFRGRQILARQNIISIVLITALIYVLARSKYYVFVMSIWSSIAGMPAEVDKPFVMVGLSFITFSAISYVVDVYKGKAESGSLLDCALYLSFFPKIVSGPIVLWRDFAPQILQRKTTLDMAVAGINRIMLGFAKKIILADSFGACLAQMNPTYGIDTITAWGAVLLYMLQIYYDFAGYSDIAIGLSLLFGFQCRENFDFPYRSCSVTEFWRRWHISLGAWFKEYVYIPLGGSRCTLRRTMVNLAVVFVLTGIWHGAGWMFVLWGGMNGVAVIIERFARDKSWYKKIPEALKWLTTFSFTMLAWEFFRFDSLAKVAEWLKIMLGMFTFDRQIFTYEFYFTDRVIFLSIVGLCGATVLGNRRILEGWRRFSATGAGYVLQESVLLVMFVLSLIFMINVGYKPFIYFQF